MRADLAVWDVERPAELAYRIGFNPLHRARLRGPVVTLTLTPGRATLAELEALWRGGAPARLDPDARPGVEAAAALVREAARGGEAVYGVNTGFGKLASVKIAAADTEALQRNLILSHCCGVGDALDLATTRLMMALKLLSLGRGASGVAWGTGGADRGDAGARRGARHPRPGLGRGVG